MLVTSQHTLPTHDDEVRLEQLFLFLRLNLKLNLYVNLINWKISAELIIIAFTKTTNLKV